MPESWFRRGRGGERPKRLSYANVAATVALFVALSGGTALAAHVAKHYLISSKGQIKPSVLKKLHGRRGAPGANGAVGAVGAIGATGGVGSTGPAGSTGPSGVVTTGSWSGTTATIPVSSGFVFAGTPATLTTTAVQRFTVSGSAALATGATTATIEVSICIQPSAGGTIKELNPAPGGAFESAIATTTRIPFAAAATGVPGAGTWNVGLCIDNTSATQAIDNNDWSIGYAQVTN
jgi:hypothetical protein